MTGVIAYPKVLKNSCNGQFLTDHYKSIDLCFTLLASGELVLKRLFAISQCLKKPENVSFPNFESEASKVYCI